MLGLLISLVVVVHGVAPLDLPGVSAVPYEDVPWRTDLCCELPDAAQPGPDGATESSGPHSGGSALNANQLKCHKNNSTGGWDPTGTHTHSSAVVCLNILCWLDEEKANLICIRKLQSASANRLVTVSLRHWPAGAAGTGSQGDLSEEDPGQCTHDDQTCSVALKDVDAHVYVMVNVTSARGSVLSTAMHIATRRLNPPGNVHYTTDLQKEVVLRWSPPQPATEALRYQVRYFSSKQPGWQFLSAVNDSWLALRDLSVYTFYTVQVRSQSLQFLEHWSNWSQPLYLCLSGTCYMPEVVFTSPGSNVTVYCAIQDARRNATNVRWWLNGQYPIPESQYRVINDYVSAVTWQTEAAGVDVLFCCEKGENDLCNPPYAKVYTTGSYSADLKCQTTVDSTNKMTCTWDKSIWSEDQLIYKWYDGPCDDMNEEEELADSVPQVAKCQRGDSRLGKCTLETVRLISCYKLWLEEVRGEGQVKSHPVYVTPIDLVKPSPPTDVQAVSMPNGSMRLAWSRTDLTGYELEYMVRYTAAGRRANPQYQGPQLESWAEVTVPEPCVVYKVEVCCKRHNGSGHWSDWSQPRISTIKNSLAPERGPAFWRELKEDSVRNQVNVTLLFKPLPIEDPPQCVDGLVVQHQASGGAVWSSETAVGASHTFLLGQEPLTVTVMARNSVGNSSNNSILTLSKNPKRQSVQKFTGRVINGTCVDLAWALLPIGPAPLGFVIEWLDHSWELEQRGQAAAGKVQWIRVPPTGRAVYVHGHFYSAEQYKFTLYTLYKDGEGEPVQCISSREDPAAYMLLMIIAFLAVVLFVTLIISQNQMKRLVWKEVPDPNKCSWAQGVDLKKVENIESLFRHPEGLTACPLLLVSEVISEAEIVEKTIPATVEKKREAGVLSEESTDLPNHTPLLDPACGLVSGTGTSGILETPESSSQSSVSGQSSVTYATVLLNDKPCRRPKRNQENLSNSSDEGNFSANNSDISGSFTGGLWEMEHLVLETGEADPRHSCTSVEEFSEISEEEEDEVSGSRKLSSELYYLGMGCQEDDEDEEGGDGDDEEEEEEEEEPMNHEGPDLGSLREEEVLVCVEPDSESDPPLTRQDSKSSCSSCASQRGLRLYLPQFRKASTKPLTLSL
ncbi:leptin receptor [Clupea harengus]|uniref:Leptin receptor n=1 Tax=Clupea harengus TaxID=7950 RepID=A0A6P8FS49_CLUHA|nr:leptin receptor [Clupea harengus]XP_031430874.1 leptin receptor [Clupea harengus]